MRESRKIDQMLFASDLDRKERDYWLNKLSGNLIKSFFPYDYKKSDFNERRVSTVTFKIAGELFSRVKKICKGVDASLHVLLAAGVVALLEKYTGNNDIIVGIPIYKQDTEGEFVNTVLAIRNQVRKNMTFKQLLLQVHETIFESIEYQNYPIEMLPEKLNLPFAKNEFPLLDTVILLENIHDKAYIEHINHNMTFSFNRKNESVVGIAEYNSQLYRKTTVERIVTHFTQLLKSAFQNLDLKVSELKILSEEEKKEILFDFNNTRVDYPKDTRIHELFEEQSAAAPDNIAAVFPYTGNLQLTYRKLNEKSNQLALQLRGKGVESNDIVGITAERSMEMIIGILGILKAGGAYLPIAPDYPKERIKYMLAESNARVLVSEWSEVSKVSGGIEVVKPGELSEEHPTHPVHLTHPTHPTHLCYIIYTSGTTGKPKGVVIEHYSLVNRLNWMQRKYPITRNDVILQKTPFTFDVSVWEIFWWAIEGARVCLLVPGGEKDSEEIIKTVEKNDVSIIHFVPSMLGAFMDYVKTTGEIERLSSLEQVFASGEALTPQQVRDFDQLFNKRNGTKLANLYGPTEATIDVSYFDCSTGDDFNEIPIGKPIHNIQLFILNKHNRFQPVGVAGELCISGHGLARGYLNRPELTADKFDQDFWDYQDEKEKAEGSHHSSFLTHHSALYRTGDLARWMPDGNIEFLGRMDHQVKMRGFRIELAEIESQLLNHQDVKQAVVTAKKDQKGDTYLCAYVVVEGTLAQNNPGLQLKEYLSHTLPDYMIPSFFIPLERLLLTPNGKIDRNALPDPTINGGDENSRPYIAPRNELETKLVDIWSHVLGIEKEIISIDSNFFELGGHSLKATILGAHIHKEFSTILTLFDLFKAPTIKGISEKLKELPDIKFSSIRPVEKKEYYKLSSAQESMYIVQQLEPVTINYNIFLMVMLEGKSDRGKLEAIFRKLIKRHESLRTSLVMVDGEPWQKIHHDTEKEFFVKCFETEKKEAKETVRRFIRPFELNKAPLLRVGLIKIGEMRNILIVDMHHMISDGVSLDILINEFISLYGGEELSERRLQYKDYSEWQNREKENVKRQEAFWLKKFEGEIPVLNIPTDFPRPTVQNIEGSIFTFTVGKEETRALKKLALEEDASIQMILLAIFNTLLFKITGQEDIIIGTTIHGRKHADLQNIIGMFANTLAIRNFPSGEKRFLEFLKEVKENFTDAYENQDYSFEDLVGKVWVNRGKGHHPLLDIMFEIRTAEEKQRDESGRGIPGLKVKPYEFETKTTIFDQDWLGVLKGENLHFSVTYCTTLYKKETIELMVEQYLALIESIKNNVDFMIKDLDCKTLVEKELKKIALEDIKFKF